MLDVDQLHLEAALVDEAGAGLQLLGLGPDEAVALVAVGVGEGAQDAPAGRLAEELQGARRGLAQDLAQLLAAVGAQHHLVAALVGGGTGVELAQEAHGPVPHDPGAGHVRLLSPRATARE